MHTGSRPKEWNATGDLGTNHSVPAHTMRIKDVAQGMRWPMPVPRET